MHQRVPGVPLVVVAQLGGATAQAVDKAESPRRWLDYRMRWTLLPPEGQDQRPAAVKAYAMQAVKALIEQQRPYLLKLGQQPKLAALRGRPRRLTLEGFRAFLEVKADAGAEGEEFLRAFARYLKQLLDRLFEALRAMSPQGVGLPGEEWLPLSPKPWRYSLVESP